ncbi:MAG: hypothetical protein JWN15_3671 [Firmicutes bacterium]|nr:hypothetical protein [Bacillota bacterium]
MQTSDAKSPTGFRTATLIAGAAGVAGGLYLASGTPIGQLFWPWFLSRGSGIVAYVLLWASVCLGLMQSSHMLKGITLPAANIDVHDFLSVASLHATLFHALILTWDSYIALHLKDVLIPFATAYKPFPMAIGIIAFYLCLIATVTTYLRAYLKPLTWRTVHQVTSCGFALALLHGVLTGTDGNLAPIAFLYFFTGATAALLLLYRIYLAMTERNRPGSARSTGGL